MTDTKLKKASYQYGDKGKEKRLVTYEMIRPFDDEPITVFLFEKRDDDDRVTMLNLSEKDALNLAQDLILYAKQGGDFELEERLLKRRYPHGAPKPQFPDKEVTPEGKIIDRRKWKPGDSPFLSNNSK